MGIRVVPSVGREEVNMGIRVVPSVEERRGEHGDQGCTLCRGEKR